MYKKILILSSVVLLSGCQLWKTSNMSPTPPHVYNHPASTIKENPVAECKNTNNYNMQKLDIILNAQKDKKTHVYRLHNFSKEKIWFNHESNNSLSAGWNSQINPGKYSAIVVNQPNFALACTQLTSSGISYLKCKDYVKVCEITNADTKKADGEFWSGENHDIKGLNEKLIQHHLLD